MDNRNTTGELCAGAGRGTESVLIKYGKQFNIRILFQDKHRGEEGQSVGDGAAQQQQDVCGRLEAAVQELQDSAEETRILGTVSVTETAAGSSSTRGTDPR